MFRILLSISSLLAGCTPSPQKAVMPSPSPVAITVQNPQSSAEETGSMARDLTARGVESAEQATPNPAPVAAAVAQTSAPSPLTDSPAERLGRRILSTAFVRVGPDGHLTVELRDGHVMVLRDVVMRPKDYCGVQVADSPARARYCGGYAEVAAARAGGAAADNRPANREP